MTSSKNNVRRLGHAMLWTAAALASLPFISAAFAQAEQKSKKDGNNMTVVRAGEKSASAGSSEYFTGNVKVKMLAETKEPSRVSIGEVTFEPGARTVWHTHPAGQHLIITSGIGWVQREGGPKEVVQAGDVVWFPPNTRHWHGAADTSAMTHYAIQETVGESPVDWMEHVTDEQYSD